MLSTILTIVDNWTAVTTYHQNVITVSQNQPIGGVGGQSSGGSIGLQNNRQLQLNQQQLRQHQQQQLQQAQQQQPQYTQLLQASPLIVPGLNLAPQQQQQTSTNSRQTHTQSRANMTQSASTSTSYARGGAKTSKAKTSKSKKNQNNSQLNMSNVGQPYTKISHNYQCTACKSQFDDKVSSVLFNQLYCMMQFASWYSILEIGTYTMSQANRSLYTVFSSLNTSRL